MQFIFDCLTNLWDMLSTIASFIVDGFKYAIAVVNALGNVSKVLPTILGIFPPLVFGGLMTILVLFVTFRILRFMTFQG